MKIRGLLILISLPASIICSSCHPGRAVHSGDAAYHPADQALYDTIALQDSLLFRAFNARDLEGMKRFFAGDLELYQDNEGLRNFAETMGAFKELFTKDYVLTRTLVKGSLEVYPIRNYGAIETGRHTFFHVENGKPVSGTFKFANIWRRLNGEWKITRLITYDHKPRQGE